MQPSRMPKKASSVDYVTRVMLSLAGSILIVVIAVNLPLFRLPAAIGWQVVRPEDQLTLEQLGLGILSRAAPPSAIEIVDDKAAPSLEGENPIDAEPAEFQLEAQVLSDESEKSELRKLEGRQAIMDFTEDMPEIVGGLGAYYIHITYPDEAARSGIEGRLVLEFVVEPDGWPSSIIVARSLHPLCDSAAVEALRRTRFVPGRHNGDYVRVRMRLPVRFQLIDRSPTNTPRTTTKPAPEAETTS